LQEYSSKKRCSTRELDSLVGKRQAQRRHLWRLLAAEPDQAVWPQVAKTTPLIVSEAGGAAGDVLVALCASGVQWQQPNPQQAAAPMAAVVHGCVRHVRRSRVRRWVVCYHLVLCCIACSHRLH
jgi:hypothetical protein